METRANGEWKNSFPHREVQLVKRLNLDQPLTDATDIFPRLQLFLAVCLFILRLTFPTARTEQVILEF